MKIKQTLLLLFLLVGQSFVFAQNIRISENEIQIQDKYIEAMNFQQLGKFEKAADLYMEVLKLDGKCDAAYFQLARIAESQGDNRKAIEQIQKAITGDPKNRWYRLFLADLYEKMGKDREAAQILQVFIDAPNTNETASEDLYFRLANCWVRAGESAKGLKIYEALEKKWGLQEETTMRKYTLLVNMGKGEQALVELRKFAQKEPNNLPLQYNLAEAETKMGNTKEALMVWENILRIAPDDQKAQTAIIANKRPSGEADLKAFFAKPEVNIDLKIKEIIPYINQVADTEDKELAKKTLVLAQIIQQIHPAEAKSYAILGDLLYHSGEAEKALVEYRKCLSLNKLVYSVWEQTMMILNDLEKNTELLPLSEEAIELFPNQASAFYYNGLATKNKPKEAIPSLQQAVLMAANKPILKADALGELGLLLAQTNERTAAESTFQEALLLNVTYPRTLIKYALALNLQDIEAPKALQLANDALENAGDKDSYVLEAYGDFNFKINQKEIALQYWQKAQNAGRDTPSLKRKITAKNLE